MSPEIIGFSNRIAYEPDGIRLIPVRQPGADRLAPIEAVHISDGYTRGTTNRVNPPEVNAIVDQIEKCLADPQYDNMTFGVISLLGGAQAKAIEAELLQRVAPEEWTARDLRCGDSAAFQGSERNVMFLSMVAAPSQDRRLTALTKLDYVQRYNVAASRAKDQMWVFHSMARSDLNNTEDMRFQLLDYCYGVTDRDDSEHDGVLATRVSEDVLTSPFDSLFEQRVFNRILEHGHTVIPQYDALGYRIDLVVLCARGRLAIECDGDYWHGPDQFERDLARQRDLERCGWHFFRIRESSFYTDPSGALKDLWPLLDELNAPVNTGGNQELPEHLAASDPLAHEGAHEGVSASSDEPADRPETQNEITDVLRAIVADHGPVNASELQQAYARYVGGEPLQAGDIDAFDSALNSAVLRRRLVAQYSPTSGSDGPVYRLPG